MSEAAQDRLVSCLMPTYNRRAFIPHALAYFQRQTYASRELIVLDDGEDAIEDLIPSDPSIRYHRLPRRLTLGAKLNLGCELARGEIIAHFDDDDWYAPWRLRYEIAAIGGGIEVCGINSLLYYHLGTGRAYEYRYPQGHKTWLLGSDLCYLKSFWRHHPFADINVGMDGLFAWSAEPRCIRALDNPTFAVHLIHRHNVSPKEVSGPCWRPHAVSNIAALLGEDWAYYRMDEASKEVRPRARPCAPVALVEASGPPPVTFAAPPKSIRNVFACLVHERPECVIDLVRNLHCLDPSSRIVLYDGSAQGALLDRRLPWSRWGVEIHPNPRPMKWGRLHGFALDCLRYLKATASFDVMTIVDSDQLAIRRGYSEFLSSELGDLAGLGLLSSAPARQGPKTLIAPCVTIHQERDLWRPFFELFPDGADKFVHWSFWPSTVISAEAGFALLDLFDHDRQLEDILARSKIWASEEILFPTLTALLGFRIGKNPCASAYVRYRPALAPDELDAALREERAFFIHPVARQYADPVRTRIRRNHDEWLASPVTQGRATTPHPSLIWPVLSRMRDIEGWLTDEEAELLAVGVREALGRPAEVKTLVEIGSHCGRATYILGKLAQQLNARARVVAIDTFDGIVGALDRNLERVGSTLDKFKRVISDSGLSETVSSRVGRAADMRFDEPLDFVLIDGLHDYASVALDFAACEAAIPSGGLVAFHDYAGYFPGVMRFVDELLEGGEFGEVAQAGTLKLLRRIAHAEVLPVELTPLPSDPAQEATCA